MDLVLDGKYNTASEICQDGSAHLVILMSWSFEICW